MRRATSMRVILFTGKGGVGKTTSAAATAVAAARSGVETLIMSTDAAHSLGDALDRDLTDGSSTATGIEPHLSARQVSASNGVEGRWRVVQEYLLDALDGLGVDPVVAEELTTLPGADEIAALIALRDEVRQGRWELVIVDCAPTTETLRLLALPETLTWHLDRWLPGQRGLRTSWRPAAAAAAGLVLPGPEVVDAVRVWHEQMTDVHEILTSRLSSVRLVLTPERVVIAEARRLLTSLSLFGYAVDSVVVNRVFPVAAGGDTAASWLAGWNAAQARGLAEVRDSFAPIPVVEVPYLPHEPVGPDALAELAASQTSSDDLADLLAPVGTAPIRLAPAGTGFELTVDLPFASSDDVALERRDDDLLVDVAGHHRVLTLPSALRRCNAVGASVRDGRLAVSFVPDEEVWPRAGFRT